MAHSYSGTCFCGAVEIKATGRPVAMGYCHCQSCRSWSGAPVSSFILWPMAAVETVRGAESLASFARTALSHRQYCRACGGHLMVNQPSIGLVDVFAATLPGLPFTPEMHVNYGEAVLRICDGLPKLRDFPVEAGGSGEMMDE